MTRRQGAGGTGRFARAGPARLRVAWGRPLRGRWRSWESGFPGGEAWPGVGGRSADGRQHWDLWLSRNG